MVSQRIKTTTQQSKVKAKIKRGSKRAPFLRLSPWTKLKTITASREPGSCPGFCPKMPKVLVGIDDYMVCSACANGRIFRCALGSRMSVLSFRFRRFVNVRRVPKAID